MGTGENGALPGKNGSGQSTNSSTNYGPGGGYYSKGINANNEVGSAWFNQGGKWTGNTSWIRDHSGSGGEAGAGGRVYYNNLSKIHAYNGNRITEKDFNYSIQYYGYDNNGDILNSGTPLVVVTRKDGVKIIPTYIFAQAGTIRAVYYTNQHMSQEECNRYGVPYVRQLNDVSNVLIHPSTSTAVTSYGQGIGSGAGNLEKSNGVFLPISEK